MDVLPEHRCYENHHQIKAKMGEEKTHINIAVIGHIESGYHYRSSDLQMWWDQQKNHRKI